MVSGLKLNNRKTEALWIGAYKDRECFSISLHLLEEINTLFFNFLWNGKGDKIKRNTVISDYSEGGLRMIVLISFKQSSQIHVGKEVS